MRTDWGSDAVMVGAGDDDKPVNRGAGGCLEVEENSRDLGGGRESKEEEVDESDSRRELKDASKEDAQAFTNDSINIDVNPQQGLGESLDREKLCRICHLSSELGSDANASKVANKASHAANHTAELILLGCGCNGELGMAHRHCANTWFKLRRSRLCEICGETAENVSGAGDSRFMEEWNDRRGHAGTSMSSSEGGGWIRRPFCNLLIACVVMAFILPWFFFRVD